MPLVSDSLKPDFHQHGEVVRGIFFAVVIGQDTMAEYFEFPLDKNMVNDPIRHPVPFEGGKGTFWTVGGQLGD